MTEQVLSVEKAGERLGVSARTILNWIRDGEIMAYRLNPNNDRSPFRVPVSEVEKIERQRQVKR